MKAHALFECVLGNRSGDHRLASPRLAAGRVCRGPHPPFTSGHFDQPNILAHARTTERTLPTGERGRFIEEVQSDWHQAGKKRGYNVPGEQYIAFYRTQNQEMVPLGHGATEAAARAAIPAGWDTMPGVTIEVRRQPTPAPYGAVPDAPFKESWPDLTLKQQLLEAAQDPNAQWLGFTSGQTQAARYDLSKQISRISYEPHDPGDYSLGTLYAYDKEGNQVMRQTRLEPHELDEYIGKEPADKLRQQIASHEHEASQWTIQRDPEDQMYYVIDPNGEYVGEGWSSERAAERELQDMRTGANQWETPADPTISGLDLQVGGEGMRKFYDELLPARLRKIVKQFGGTVERVPLTGRSREAIDAEMDALHDQPSEHFYERLNALQEERNTAAPRSEGWIVRLTPEMKRRLLKEGLPLMTIPLAVLGAGTTKEKQ